MTLLNGQALLYIGTEALAARWLTGERRPTVRTSAAQTAPAA